jgi:lysozyme
MNKQSNKIIVLVVIGVLIATLKSKAGSLYASALNFIKIKEGGLYLKAYQDSGGVWTIGWGSTFDFDKKRKVLPGDTITQAQAQKWLEMTTSQDANEIKKLVKPYLNKNEINALISFVYNVGINAFRNSTMLKLLNSGADKKTVANEFDRWVFDDGVKVQGLVNRRIAEKKLFLS